MHFVRRSWALLLVTLLVGCGSSEPDSKVPGAKDGGASSPRAALPDVADLPTRADGVPVAYRYRVTYDCRRTAAMPDGQQSVVDEQTQFVYSWQWQGNEAELVLHSMDLQLTTDDQLSMKSLMTGSRHMTEQGGVTVDEAFEDLNPQWQELLRSSFNAPLCHMVFDDEGNELQRTVTDRPGAKLVIDRGIVANSRLFHGPFPTGTNLWEATSEISTPFYARGTLTYEIADQQTSATDDLIEVHVSGTLTGPPETVSTEVGPVTYTLDGTIVYSKRMREWVAGNLEAELAFDAFIMQQKIPTRGKVALTMELLSSKAIDAASD
ncbi:MAG: hypothetical protein V3R99_11050 [Thermoguttaceae bacterium]